MLLRHDVAGDHIRVMAAEDGTSCKVDRSDPDGRITTENLSMGSGEFEVFDAVSDNTYRISCTNRVMVAQISKSKDATEASNDPSLIILPSVPQWANRYLFSTPEFSGGTFPFYISSGSCWNIGEESPIISIWIACRYRKRKTLQHHIRTTLCQKW